MPRPSTFLKWYNDTPKDFLFALKAPRTITHLKKLKNVKGIWEQFLENAKKLKEKLGPILFQFPPSFKLNKENKERLKKFLELLLRYSQKNLKCTFEFRHKTWLDQEIYNLLKKFNCAWTIADSSYYPKSEAITADFVYIRMHGPEALFASKYSKSQLKELALKIKKWQKEGKEIFVYFNNDFYGYAIEDALYLKKLLKV